MSRHRKSVAAVPVVAPVIPEVVWESPLGKAVLTNVHDPRKIKRRKKRNSSVTSTKNEHQFKTEPVIKFPADEAEQMIAETLFNKLDGKTYDPVAHPILCKVLARDFKRNMRLPGLDRYRLITYVTIGENLKQDVRVASRCLWDTNSDSSACAHYQNSSLFASAIMYAIYLD